MAADPYVYAEITQVDVAIVTHFLKGTQGISEEKIIDELFELKPFISTLGNSEVEKVIKKCNEQGNYDKIIPRLKDAELEDRKNSKHGFFKWIFKKGKEDKATFNAPVTDKKEKNSRSSENVDEKEIKPRFITLESPLPPSTENNKESKPGMAANSSDSQTTYPRITPFVFQTRLQRHEEFELSKQYNFQSNSNNLTLPNTSDSTPQNDREFQEIYRRFFNEFSEK